MCERTMTMMMIMMMVSVMQVIINGTQRNTYIVQYKHKEHINNIIYVIYKYVQACINMYIHMISSPYLKNHLLKLLVDRLKDTVCGG